MRTLLVVAERVSAHGQGLLARLSGEITPAMAGAGVRGGLGLRSWWS